MAYARAHELLAVNPTQLTLWIFVMAPTLNPTLVRWVNIRNECFDSLQIRHIAGAVQKVLKYVYFTSQKVQC